MKKISLGIAAILMSASATIAHESEPVVSDPTTGTTTPISQLDMSSLTPGQVAGIASQLRSKMSNNEITQMLEEHPNMRAMATEMQREMGNRTATPGSGMGNGNAGGSMGNGNASGGMGSGNADGGMDSGNAGGGMGSGNASGGMGSGNADGGMDSGNAGGGMGNDN